MKIIGITGTLGSGKGEVGAFLRGKGFSYFSVRNFLIEELKRRKSPINRGTMTDLADELRKTHKPSYIIEEVYAQAVTQGGNTIIESVRAKAEADFLKKKGAILIAVDADPRVRYGRIVARKSDLDHVSYEKFISDEQREMDSVEPNRGNIRDCMRRADFVLMNDSSIEELHAQIEKILPSILK
jgi:dephospho-CoA kinase